MFKDNRLNALLSVVIALLLWVYVVGEVNPSTTGKISGVAVTFLNEDVLEADGLALVDPGDITVDVTIKGNRSDVLKISADDILVTADLSELETGTQTLKLKVSVPTTVTYVKISQESIEIEIDSKISMEMEVEVEFIETTYDMEDPVVVDIDPETVVVTGAAKTLATIDKLVVEVPVTELASSPVTLTRTIVAEDASGKQVNHISLSQDKAQVTASLSTTKTVDLIVETTGTLPDDLELDSIDAPSTVTLWGDQAVLDTIDSITASPIDLSGITTSETVTLELDLPEGVHLANADSALKATVNILASATKAYTFEVEEILITNLDDGLMASVEGGEIICTLSGSQSSLEAVTADSISLYVDASSLTAGEYTMTLKASCPEGVTASMDPTTITLVIEEEE